jgi:hypothetical protein
MFIEINNYEIQDKIDGTSTYFYEIIDSSFQEETSISGITRHSRAIAPEVAVINKYLEKGLPIPSNIARLYLYYSKVSRLHVPSTVEGFKTMIDDYFPHLNYGKLYYPCVLRQIKQLSFGRVK